MTNTTTAPLAGRVAVVTGASSGIGAATAKVLAAQGAKVALLARREDRIKELASELGAGVITVAADVSDAEAVSAAATTVRAELGPVDLVVANAGVMLAAPFEKASLGEWDQMITTNISGLLYTGRAFADDLLAAAAAGKRADLVHVGSIGGHIVLPNYGVYTATKAAVAHLTRNLRAELGPRGVRVHTIEPGMVASELGDGMRDEEQREFLANFRTQIPPIGPEHIADAIAYSAAAPPQVNIAELIVVPTVQG
jgi:NADP-dependent 3-hydroxy acid dehydrogenase YdfG